MTQELISLMAEEEGCEDCETAALGGMTLKICSLIPENQQNCKELYVRFTRGQITLNELIENVEAKVPPGSELAEDLQEIKKLANE